jgi:hypothetical protein
MSVTTGTSLRTIWIEIRAMNYAINTLNDVLRQLTMLQQQEELSAIACLNMTKAAMSAGILFGVLGNQIGGLGGQIFQFGSYVLYGVAVLNGLIAVTKIVQSGILTTTIAINGLNIAMWQIYVIVGAAAAIFYALQGYLGPIPALIIAITIAVAALVAVLTVLSYVSGFGAFGWIGRLFSAGATAFTPMGFQVGTRAAEFTGPAIVHKGEVIYNPSTGRPTQVGNELAGSGYSETHIDASVHDNTINTKADEEQLDDLLRKRGRQIANDRR